VLNEFTQKRGYFAEQGLIVEIILTAASPARER
jgi:hypothetical protein